MGNDIKNECYTKEEYYSSLGSELQSIKNRVRNLIGSGGWSEEGRYKEVILMNMLSRFLPKGYSLGTGYVISIDEKGVTGRTKQIDIIIYDNSFPVFFKERGFVILPPDSVRGIIEVKSMIHEWKENLKDEAKWDFKKALRNMNDNANFIANNFKLHSSVVSHFFNGVFSYELDPKLTPDDVLGMVESIYAEIKEEGKDGHGSKYPRGFPGYICVNKDIFIYGYSHKFRCCKTDDLATFWFISLLLKSIDYQKTDETFWKDWGDIVSHEMCSFPL